MGEADPNSSMKTAGTIISAADFIETIGTCRSCGCDVSGYCANEALVQQRPAARGSDYWAACDNPDCENRNGEDYFQGFPDWVI